MTTSEMLENNERSTKAVQTVETKPDLTSREQEIAEYAAEGVSNQQIARLLVVSVRTVEGHLQRVYTKLGISRRRELREAMASLGAPAEGEAEEEPVSWGDINRLHLANNLAAVYGRNHKNSNARWAAVADEAIRLIQSTD